MGSCYSCTVHFDDLYNQEILQELLLIWTHFYVPTQVWAASPCLGHLLFFFSPTVYNLCVRYFAAAAATAVPV